MCRPHAHEIYEHCCCAQPPPPHFHHFCPSVSTVEEEVRELEEYREALERELEKTRQRLKALSGAVENDRRERDRS